LSDTVCDTIVRSQQTTCRSYAALEPVFSERRTDSQYTLNEPVSYVSTMVGWFWISSGDAVCMTLPKSDHIIRAAGAPKPGATARLMGSLRDAFPELKELSEEDLKHLLRRMRR
jgi:hypothetical protein